MLRRHPQQPLGSSPLFPRNHCAPPCPPAPPNTPTPADVQVWQWVRFGVRMDDGQPLTLDRVNLIVQEELDKLRQQAREWSLM